VVTLLVLVTTFWAETNTWGPTCLGLAENWYRTAAAESPARPKPGSWSEPRCCRYPWCCSDSESCRSLFGGREAWCLRRRGLFAASSWWCSNGYGRQLAGANCGVHWRCTGGC